LNKSYLILFGFLFIKSFAQTQRHPAEWEPISAVVMEYHYFEKTKVNLTQILDPYLKIANTCIEENVKLYILNPSKKSLYAYQVNLDSVFKSHGIFSPLIKFITKDSIDERYPWIRDHGLNFVYQNGISQPIIYNFPEDKSGSFVAKNLHLKNAIIKPENTHEYYTDGGNFLTDGHGTFNICATDLTTDLPTEILPKYDYFYQKFGIKKTVNLRMPFVHVDYFLKLINEETFLVSYIPHVNYDLNLDKFTGHQSYIDEAVLFLSNNLKSAFNRPFKFIYIQNAPTSYDTISNRILHTANATYTNALILNKQVLVPQYQNKSFDSLALATYKKAMPGYKIIGVNCRYYGTFSGAIHCMTHEIYNSKSIYIKHKWPRNPIKTLKKFYPIKVQIISNSKNLDVYLYWRFPKKGFKRLTMKKKNDNFYTAYIPINSKEKTIDYFIEVKTKYYTTKRPVVAPKNTYHLTFE